MSNLNSNKGLYKVNWIDFMKSTQRLVKDLTELVHEIFKPCLPLSFKTSYNFNFTMSHAGLSFGALKYFAPSN